MKRIILITTILLLCLGADAAEKLNRITLKDESVIIGRISEMKNGKYVVETTTLGQLVLDEDNILEIRPLAANEKAAESEVNSFSRKRADNISIRDGSKKRRTKSPAREKYEESSRNFQGGSSDLNRQQEEVNSRVKSMTADGDFINSLLDLGQSGNMLDVMSDPEVMEAIARNDYDFLMNNEKMKALMESSEIRDLLGDVEP